MDVHRCRFVDFSPSAINALAFSHASQSIHETDQVRLAIGRANGDIEIWNPLDGIWHLESTLFGGKERSIEGLAWVQNPNEQNDDGRPRPGALRLFSIGSSSAVTEWDLVTGLPIRQSSGSHSEVWCIATQPLPPPPSSKVEADSTSERHQQHVDQNIAVGCADGSMVLLSTANNDLTFERYVARTSEKKARALCIAWRSSDIVAIGFSNSTIRVYNISDRRRDTLLRQISLGGGPKGGPRGGRKEKLVWAMSFLPDGTLVSGDSAGEICWWDRQNYGQVQRIQAHDADVLCLTNSSDGMTVVSGGIDRRTITYHFKSSASSSQKRWMKMVQRKIHEGDVKTMASYESKRMSVVVSGGPDAYPTVTPLKGLKDEYYRRIPSTPQTPPVAGAQRFVLSWKDTQLTIWQVRGRSSNRTSSAGRAPGTGYDVVAQMAIKGDENISSANISSNGKLLAVATMAEVRLFRLKRKKGQSNTLKISKLSLPAALAQSGGRLLRFSPDAKWLLTVSRSNTVMVVGLVQSDEYRTMSVSKTVETLRCERMHESNDAWSAYLARIACAEFSDDSQLLAVANLTGYIDVWQLHRTTNVKSISKRADASNSTEDAHMSSDSSEADSSETEALKSCSLYTTTVWRPVSSDKMLPRLPSAPLLISFCPLAKDKHGSDNEKINGDLISGQQRRSSTTKDSLVVITSRHEFLEFSALEGRLTSWARRNPTSSFPAGFRVQRDRAIGCLWDCKSENNADRKRLWVYASSWLGMFDLKQDFPLGSSADKSQQSKALFSSSKTRNRKRKRAHEQETPRIRRHVAGAGDIQTRSQDGADSQQMDRETEARSPNEVKSVSTVLLSGAGRDSPDGADDDTNEDYEGASSALLRQRRQSHTEASVLEDGAVARGAINGDLLQHDQEKETDARESTGGSGRDPSFYLTTKYQPIIGIVTLSDVEESDEGGIPVLEIAVIERPECDVNRNR